MPRIAWIAGWGVEPESLSPSARHLAPDAEHLFLPPTPDFLPKVGASDLLIAWSLGALRVLDSAAAGWQFPGQVILLAPFIAFCAEHGCGGKCTLTQIRYLKRWVLRDPEAAVADFYARAGLGIPTRREPVPVPMLLEGLDRLGLDASPLLRRFAGQGLPSNWQAWVGDADPLLDPSGVASTLKSCRVLQGGGHSIADLLGQLRSQLPL
jgi:hypothetical protein